MNWQEIKEKYPKAFELLDESVDIFWEKDREANKCRFLYDFFDEQGISIIIEWSHSENPTIDIDWYYEITNFELPAKIFEVNNVYAGTRTMAEEQAFLKAFEILENKLR